MSCDFFVARSSHALQCLEHLSLLLSEFLRVFGYLPLAEICNYETKKRACGGYTESGYKTRHVICLSPRVNLHQKEAKTE